MVGHKTSNQTNKKLESVVWFTWSGNPLYKGAVIEDRRFGQIFDVDEIESTPLVSKEQLLARLVQLEPVDLRVVTYLKKKF